MLDSALAQALVKLEALEGLLHPYPGSTFKGITQQECAAAIHDIQVLIKASLDHHHNLSEMLERKSHAAGQSQ